MAKFVAGLEVHGARTKCEDQAPSPAQVLGSSASLSAEIGTVTGTILDRFGAGAVAQW